MVDGNSAIFVVDVTLDSTLIHSTSNGEEGEVLVHSTLNVARVIYIITTKAPENLSGKKQGKVVITSLNSVTLAIKTPVPPTRKDNDPFTEKLIDLSVLPKVLEDVTLTTLGKVRETVLLKNYRVVNYEILHVVPLMLRMHYFTVNGGKEKVVTPLVKVSFSKKI